LGNDSTGKIERILEKYEMFCFNINKSGINYTKNHKNIIEDRKKEQNKMIKSLLEYEKKLKMNLLILIKFMVFLLI
jgi:hypothetical protein